MATGALRRVTDLEKIIRLLATRMSWTMGAKVIDAAGLYRSRGWEETVKTTIQRTLDTAARARATESLTKALQRHMLVGGKQVYWYDWNRLGKADLAASREWVTSTAATKLLGEAGPRDVLSLPYQESDLRPLLGVEPQLIRVTRGEDRLTCLFFSARSFTTRESIDVAGMPPAQRRRFDDYLEVIGVKARSIPCFDAVVFDLAKNRVEVRMDRQQGIQSDGADKAYSDILGLLNRAISVATAQAPLGHGFVNFFPAVNRLYLDQTAGLVEMLGFVATSADRSSNNKGVVHRRADQDLRADPFHVGGKNAVGTIEPYTIGISAESASGMERLHLELHSNARALLGAGGARFISAAVFDGCATPADFALLTSLLEDHLIAPTA